MPKIPHVIQTRNFEHVRRRVAEILQIELNNQSAIGYDEDLNLTVWEERIAPISHAEKRVVNVRLNSDEFDNFFQLNKDGTISIAVDVYATYAGDGSLSMKKLQKILGVIDAILSDSRYKTLGFAKPSLSRVQVNSIEIADQKVQHDATNTCIGRVNLSVRVQETVEPVTPTLLEGYDTIVLISDSDSGYQYETPSLCFPGTVQIINSANQVIDVVIVDSGKNKPYNLADTPVLVTDQDGNPLANESLPSVTGGTIEVEITPTPCADATVQINGEQVATVASGGMVNIAVENESGTPIGSFDEDTGVWVVPNCEDGTVTVNRDAVLFADVPVASGGTASINVPSNCPLPTYFEMTIKTDNAGTSASNQIIMPFFGNTGVQIDRGDGIIQHYFVSGGISVNNSITLSYATAGVYTIKVFGQISRLNFNVGSDALKVLSVNYWGLTQYGAILQDFFRGTANLALIALDAPNLSAVTSMVNFFRNSGVNANLSHWVLGAGLTTMDGILRSSNMSTANYTDTIVGWALKVGAPINVSAGSQNDMIFDTSRAVNIPAFPSITTAGQARTFITTPVASGGLGWTISGDTVI